MNRAAIIALGIFAAAAGSAVCAPAAYAAAISYGQTVSGSITTAGQKNDYAFSGASGDVITARFVKTSGNIYATADIVNPSGTVVATSYTGSVGATLAATGTFKLVMRDYYGNGTGNYALSVQRVNNPSGAVSLSYGQMVSGGIDMAAKMVSYTVTAAAGDTLTARFVPTSGISYLTVELYNPAGARIAGTYTGRFDSKVSTGGVYTIIVTDYYLAARGTYALVVQRLNNPGNAPALGFGQTVNGTISAHGDIKSYVVNAAAYDILSSGVVKNSTISGYFEPVLEFYDPAGSYLAGTSLYTTGFTLETVASGNHTLLVSDYQSNGAGTYAVNVSRLNNRDGANAAPAAGSVMPSAGVSYAEQAVTITAGYRDPDGWNNIRKAFILINTSPDAANSLYACYYQDTNSFFVRDNGNSSWIPVSGSAFAGNSCGLLNQSATTVNGTGGNLTISWNVYFTKNFTGVKNVYLSVVDDNGTFVPAAQKGTWEIKPDTTPPTALITFPANNSNVTRMVTIKGTAHDAAFSYYGVYAAAGTNPSGWTFWKQFNTPVINDTLCLWDASAAGGVWTILLNAYDKSGNLASDRRLVRVDNVAVGNVSIGAAVFNPRMNETESIRYQIDKNSYVTVALYDMNNTLIRALTNNAGRAAGVRTEIWDGKDNAGSIVVDGGYSFTIEARNQTGWGIGRYSPPVVYNPYNTVSSMNVTAELNPYAGEVAAVSYNLASSAYVLLEAGNIDDYATGVATIVNYTFRPAGMNVEYWDGWADRGVVMKDKARYRWTLLSSVPENIIGVRGDSFPLDILLMPYCIVPSAGEVSTIDVILPQTAILDVRIIAQGNTVATTLCAPASKSAGIHTFTWDGRDQNGKICVAGTYLVIAEAALPDGRKFRSRAALSIR